MSSVGQGVIGEAHFGGAAPFALSFLNQEEVDAVTPTLRFSADTHDSNENIWWSAVVRYGVSPEHEVLPQDKALWVPWRTPPSSRGGEVELLLPVSLDPSRIYTVTLGATVDPEFESWWRYRNFEFQPVADSGSISDISGFFLYESRQKAVPVEEGGTSTTNTPYADWLATGVYDYFMWNVTLDRHDNRLTKIAQVSEFSFDDYPLYDGLWYIKLAAVYRGTVGPIFTFSFRVDQTEVIADMPTGLGERLAGR